MSASDDSNRHWEKVNRPIFYFIKFNADSTVEDNIYTNPGTVKGYRIINDSNISLVLTNGTAFNQYFKISRFALEMGGVCYEGCWSKFIQKLPL